MVRKTQSIIEAIIHERVKNGPFLLFEDFLERTESHIHLQDVRILIKAGCFDDISNGIPRSGLIWQAIGFFDQKNVPAQVPLFEADPAPYLPCTAESPQPAPYPKDLMLKHESEALGFNISVHPLDLYSETLKGIDYVRARDL
ncbi:MAG: hypothetical protein JRI73_13485, partial [Deltaproteobacteria bacterium]|nr:hypothetical protein [Deltaproteobacteria bacterium]